MNSGEQLNKKGNKRGMNSRSRANLRPNPAWKPGVSGNPEGLSLKKRVVIVLRQIVDETGKMKIDQLAEAIVDDAIAGNAGDRKEIWDRLEGKLGLTVGGGDQPIKHIIEVVDTETKKALADFLKE